MKSLTSMAVAFGLTLAALAAGAFEIVPYSAQALEHARRTDSPIALHFHSKWCITCRQQTKVFEQLRGEPQLELTLLVVNFDTNDDLVREFRVASSGVVIVLRGGVERARLIGVTDRDDLVAGLRKGF